MRPNEIFELRSSTSTADKGEIIKQAGDLILNLKARLGGERTIILDITCALTPKQSEGLFWMGKEAESENSLLSCKTNNGLT